MSFARSDSRTQNDVPVSWIGWLGLALVVTATSATIALSFGLQPGAFNGGCACNQSLWTDVFPLMVFVVGVAGGACIVVDAVRIRLVGLRLAAERRHKEIWDN